MTRNDVPLGIGQCDIRLRVDGDVEVSVRQDRVFVRTFSGRDARDAGSECNEPLPTRFGQRIDFNKLDGRGEMLLLDSFNRQNRTGAVVRIRDNQGGEGRYHFRLSWSESDGRYGGYGTSRGRGNDGYETRDGYPYPGSSRYPNDRNNLPPYRRSTGTDEAIRSCVQEVRVRLSRDYRYSSAEILNTRIDNRQGRSDMIVGDAIGRRGRTSEQFNFSCSVNFANGNVRNVELWH